MLTRFPPQDGHYTDAFVCDVAARVSLGQFLMAFYRTPLFRAERLVLALVGRGGSDAQIADLASDRGQRFAAWTVEDRSDTQILMCDVQGATRSWFWAEARQTGTRLWFGSAVVARPGRPLGAAVRALTPAHRLYSRGLLAAAARRLRG